MNRVYDENGFAKLSKLNGRRGMATSPEMRMLHGLPALDFQQ